MNAAEKIEQPTGGFFNEEAVRVHAIERATVALRRTVLHQLEYVGPDDIRRVLQQIIETDLK